MCAWNSGGARLLVTGAAGFLGGRIAEALAARPDVASVTRLDRLAAPGVLAGEVSRVAALLPSGFEVDAVVHAAAITTQASEAAPEAAWAINVEGTRALLAWCAARPRPPRLLLLSSTGVFGGGEAAPDEHSRPRPASVYGTTKVVAELLLLDAARRGVVDAAVLRLPISVIRTTRHGPPGAGFLSDLVAHARRGAPFVAPLAADHALPVASVRAAVEMACRMALTLALPARLLHLPSLAVSGADAIAALRTEGIAAERLVTFQPDDAVQRLVAGWPRRLATAYPEFADDLRDADFASLLRDQPG